MTGKIYKSAMGKPVDLGALILENEQVRAVGNMGVNARGDVVDSGNRVIDSKNRQVQRQYKKQATVNEIPVSTGTVAARKQKQQSIEDTATKEVVDELSPVELLDEPAPVVEETSTPIPRGGLAAALAKSQAVKQELMKTPRQLAQEKSGVKKI